MNEHKRCCHCGQYKPLDDFYRHANGVLGRHKRCKACAQADAQRRAQQFTQRRLERVTAVSAADLSGRA